MTTLAQLQELCEQGQQLLVTTDYLGAERVLAAAEKIAWQSQWWETLARLYMPLQEARRQIRQRCGEGVVRLDLWSIDSPLPTTAQILARYPHGQLLIAAQASLAHALALRDSAQAQNRYVETFLAAAYLVQHQQLIVVVGLEDVALPAVFEMDSMDEFRRQLPAGALIYAHGQLPSGARPGSPETYAQTMSIWERLHEPHLRAADAETDPLARMAGYRRAIQVDRACELAHQRLADIARRMYRQGR